MKQNIVKLGWIAALCVATVPALGQEKKAEKAEPIRLTIPVDGKAVTVVIDGKNIQVTQGGKPFDPARIKRVNRRMYLSDATGNPFAAVENFGNGAWVRRLRRSDKVSIGIESKPIPRALANHLDIKPEDVIYIARVVPGRAAAKAGVLDHDIVVGIDGDAPVNDARLKAVMKKKKPGESMELNVLRRGKTKTIPVACERTPLADFMPGGSFGFPNGSYLISPEQVTFGRYEDLLRGKDVAWDYWLKTAKKSPSQHGKPGFPGKVKREPKGTARPGAKGKAGDKVNFFVNPNEPVSSGFHGYPGMWSFSRSREDALENVEDRLRRLEERFDRFEELLEKLLNKKKI